MPQKDGFQVRIEQNILEEERLSLPLQVVYIVSGNAKLTLRGKTYEMAPEDMILINGMEPYWIRTAGDGFVCTLSIDYELIARMAPDNNTIVMTLNSLEIPNRPYGELREIFRELVYFEVTGNARNKARRMSRLYEFLDILLRHCALPSINRSGNGKQLMTDTEKLIKIMSYVNANYRNSLSLRELAESMYTSTSTLSRFFRKQTGEYFANYLNRVRLSHAAAELTQTDRNITTIALSCGFSSSSSFSALFREAYGMSPLEYRRAQSKNARIQEDTNQELRAMLSGKVEESSPPAVQTFQNEKTVVSVSDGKPFSNPWNIVLNMGSLSALTFANVQYHLLEMARDLHMTHVKIWSVFAKSLRITDGKTKGGYNYNMVDAVLDSIVEKQLAVYFDFGSRPDMILSSSSNALLSEDVGIAFKSRSLWEDLFEDFIKHLVHRYGREEISRWIFDFCIDPSFRGFRKYYDDPAYDYQNIFMFACRTLRRLVPGAKVGGPAGIPNSPRNEIETFLRRCSQENCYPDFVSTTLFPYQPNAEGDGFEREPDPEFEAHQLGRLKELISRISGRKIPLYVTDWNLSVSNRNAVNDSCCRGAYYCGRASRIMEYADLCSIWIASDWISNYFDIRQLLVGGGGLLTRDTIRKPAYYALQFLCELRGTLLHSSPGMIVTMTSPRSILIVCSNQVSFNVGYFLKKEEEITAENMEMTVTNSPPCSRMLEICGLEDGTEYVIRTRSVNRRYGSIQDEWKRFDYEGQLTREDIKYLSSICVPHLGMTRERVQDGKLSHRIVLDEQEFQLLHIFQVSEEES